MRRTQIYLSDEQGRMLETRSRATRTTVSELIRQAIDATYARRRSLTRADRIRIARATAGAWTHFGETGEAYVERLRGRGRLARLHGLR